MSRAVCLLSSGFFWVHLLPSDLTACLICFSTLHIVGSLLFKLPSSSSSSRSSIVVVVAAGEVVVVVAGKVVVVVVVVIIIVIIVIVEGSLNSKLPTIWTVEKQNRVVKSAERRCSSESQKKEDTSAPNVREVAKCCVFP